MRIIEPRQLEAAKKKRLAKQPHRMRVILPFAAITAAVVGLGYYSYHLPKSKYNTVQNTAVSTKKNAASTDTRPKAFRTFTGQEFVNFYNAFAYPNVTEVTDPPAITGDADADDRIRAIAVQRGYIQRSIALPPLEKVGGYQLQRLAVKPWNDMKAAAAAGGVRMGLTAAFRSVEEQRDLFVSRLYATGATVESINAGNSDAAINKTLSVTAVPGYTRHHTGYTIDILCESDPSVVFKASACFNWLSGANYANAKQYGWIPSYPENAGSQGPEPEGWEYVWVGTESLLVPTGQQNIGG